MTNPHAATGSPPDIDGLVAKLAEKYAATGQNLEAYLEGLLYQDYLNYWDYIHTDTLLSLQNTRTHFPDEQIFIIYHQISELNFKMIISELKQMAALIVPDQNTLVKRITRVNRYFEALVTSFDFMSEGMDPDQFMRFRMALLPASGFQSAQFRMIEILCTDFVNLVQPDQRGQNTAQCHRRGHLQPGLLETRRNRIEKWAENANPAPLRRKVRR